jgi:hypothetical protein
MGGMISTYFNPVGADGLTYVEREEAALRARVEREEDGLMKRFEEQMDDTERRLRVELGMLPQRRASRSVSPVRNPGSKPRTLKSGGLSAKSAATALARPTSKPSSYATATTSSKSKVLSDSLNVRKSRAVSAADPSSSRFAAATAASKSTLGYTQGRVASHQIRKTSTIYRDRAPSVVKSGKATPVFTEEDDFDSRTADVIEQLRVQDLAFIPADGDDIDLGLGLAEEEDELFQLDVPQL